MAFEVIPLPYPYEALEPYIDTQTMQLHHDKHYATYTTNLNAALEKHPQLANQSVEQILSDLNRIPEDIRVAVRNNGGGYYNHGIFWEMMAPNAGGQPGGSLGQAIQSAFGSFDSFKDQLQKTALARFGSGWAWLSRRRDGGLEIHSTANQDTPLSEGLFPILGVDVWEHAYYLKYQNRRADYLTAWWNTVNWPYVQKRFEQ